MQSLHYDGRMSSATAVAVVAPPAGVEDAECGLRERKKRETRAAIHRAALELAHEGGVDALTVDAIAERAGVSPRTFFNYFPTKDDAIIGSGASDLDALATLVAARPAGESVREIVHAIALIRMAALSSAAICRITVYTVVFYLHISAIESNVMKGRAYARDRDAKRQGAQDPGT